MFSKICNNIKTYPNYFVSGFIFLFCFVFFPIFLVDSILDILLKTNIEKLKETKLTEMSKSMEYLNKYSNNKKYIHFLLSNISKYAQNSDKSLEYIKENINNLKKKYPNSFQFVVWNHKGDIINELCDKKGYSYILKHLYINLSDVCNAVKNDSFIKISSIDSIKKNTKILQSFLGRVFIPDNLKYPIINNVNSGPLLTELGHDYNYVWYSIQPKISFLCFISDNFINDFSGLLKISDYLNKNSQSNIIYGFSSSSNYYEPITPFPEKLKSEFSVAMATFENGGDNIFENERILLKLSMPQSDIRTFCFLEKNKEDWNFNYRKNIIFNTIISFILCIYSFFCFKYLIKESFFSLRWKLIIIFLLANLAPIAVLSILTKVYIDNKKISMKNEIIDNLDKSIRDLDAQYNNLLDEYSSRLNNILDSISSKIENSEIKPSEINKLNSLFDDFKASSLFIVASNTEIISYIVDNKTSKLNESFLKYFGEYVSGFLNNKKLKINKKDLYSNIFNPEDSEFMKTFIKNIGKVKTLLLGEEFKVCYTYTIGDKEKYNINYIFSIIWNNEEFQKIFLNLYFHNIYSNYPEASYFIKSNSNHYSFGEKKLEKQLNYILMKNSSSIEKTTGSFSLDNKKYIFVCSNGTNLKDWSILAVYPEKNIDKTVNILLLHIFVISSLSILLTIIIGYILTNQFLKPINNLAEAALALNDGNFSFRIPIGDKDEFGRLNQTFNEALEGLGDFEVGKIVQNSLFPGNSFKMGDFEIYGKSIPLTTLGGDYYDCFKINDEYHGIIIGDVSGHGLPAGLIMAMAKSSVLSATNEVKLNPTELTIRLNKIFFAINNSRLKSSMTFQYFVFNVNNGHFVYTNAGHCLPIVVDNNFKTANFIDYKSIPLGKDTLYPGKNMEFDLNKGQSLVLYTDCINEVTNELGEKFDYEKFKSTIPNYYDLNPEIFYNKIYDNIFKQLSSKFNDDFSLIIINRV